MNSSNEIYSLRNLFWFAVIGAVASFPWPAHGIFRSDLELSPKLMQAKGFIDQRTLVCESQSTPAGQLCQAELTKVRTQLNALVSGYQAQVQGLKADSDAIAALDADRAHEDQLRLLGSASARVGMMSRLLDPVLNQVNDSVHKLKNVTDGRERVPTIDQLISRFVSDGSPNPAVQSSGLFVTVQRELQLLSIANRQVYSELQLAYSRTSGIDPNLADLTSGGIAKPASSAVKEDQYFSKSGIGSTVLVVGAGAALLGGGYYVGSSLIKDTEKSVARSIRNVENAADRVATRLERRMNRILDDLENRFDNFTDVQIQKLRDELEAGLSDEGLANIRAELNSIYDELRDRTRNDFDLETFDTLDDTITQINDVLNAENPVARADEILGGVDTDVATGTIPPSLPSGTTLPPVNLPPATERPPVAVPPIALPDPTPASSVPSNPAGVDSELAAAFESVNGTIPRVEPTTSTITSGASRLPGTSNILPSGLIDFSQLDAKMRLARQSGTSLNELRTMCPQEGASILGKRPEQLSATERALIDSKCSELIPSAGPQGDYAAGYANKY